MQRQKGSVAVGVSFLLSLIASGCLPASDANIGSQLLAVSVKTRELNRADEEDIQQNLEYARKLGAEVHILEGADAMAEIIRFAREQRITQIFVGHTKQSPWKVWAASPVNRLIEAAEGMDVRVFPPALSTA